jgi:hypothetical protein
MKQEFLDKIAKIEKAHGPLEEPKRPYNSSIYDIEPEDEDDIFTIKGWHLLSDAILGRYDK